MQIYTVLKTSEIAKVLKIFFFFFAINKRKIILDMHIGKINFLFKISL